VFSQESQYLQAPLINFNLLLLLQLHLGTPEMGEGEGEDGGEKLR